LALGPGTARGRTPWSSWDSSSTSKLPRSHDEPQPARVAGDATGPWFFLVDRGRDYASGPGHSTAQPGSPFLGLESEDSAGCPAFLACRPQI